MFATTVRWILALAVLAPAQAVAAAVDFDQGAEVRPILESAREGARRAEAPRGRLAPLQRYSDGDCATFTFKPEDPLLAAPKALQSRIYQRRCVPDGRGGVVCHDEVIAVVRRDVSMKVEGRGAMHPWEHDRFELCLYGYELDGRVVEASHQYRLQLPSDRGNEATVTAVAGEKSPMDPDPAGVSIATFAFEDDSLVLRLDDRWAAHYNIPQERTVLALELRRDRGGWPAETVLAKELDLAPARTYRIRFADHAAEFRRPLRPGKRYFVRWRFKRAGIVSKETWQPQRPTPAVTLPAAAD